MSTEQNTPAATPAEQITPKQPQIPQTPDQEASKFQGMSTKDGEPLDPMNLGDGNVSENDTPPQDTPKPKAKAKAEDGDEDEGEKPEKPRRSKAQDRIDQAIARQRAAERRADLAESMLQSMDQRLKAIESGNLKPGAPAPTSDPAAPKPESYEYGELDARYIRDLAKYEVRQELKAAAQQANSNEQAKVQEQRASKLADFTSKGSELYEDFDEVVVQSAQDGLWPLSPTLGELILESDVGQHIAYELATDVKLARQVAKMPLAKQAAWFGQAEARASAKGDAAKGKSNTPARLPSAPPPPQFKARGSGDINPPSSDTTDFAAFERMASAR